MDKQVFTEARDAVLVYYQGNNYSKNRTETVSNIIKTISMMVMDADIELDSCFMAKAKENRKRSTGYWNSFYHVVGMIHLAMEGKALGCRSFCQKSQESGPTTLEFSDILAIYIEYQFKLGKVRRTVENERRSNSKLLCYLEGIGINRFKQIESIHLQGYLMHGFSSLARSTAQATIYRNRRFIKYLVARGHVSPALLPVFECRVAVPKRVVTTLTESQSRDILSAPKPQTVLQARTNAVLLCSLVLGLRRSDVHKLKLTEIDWKKETIHIIQKKTRVPLKLPLPRNVGIAIASYIMNFRPKVSSEYIFLSIKAPYSQIKGSSNALEDFLSENPDKLSSGGYHILRRTCASYLLANGTAPTTIMHMLGQTSMDSLDYYLCLDEPNMALNPLDSPATGIPEVLI